MKSRHVGRCWFWAQQKAAGRSQVERVCQAYAISISCNFLSEVGLRRISLFSVNKDEMAKEDLLVEPDLGGTLESRDLGGIESARGSPLTGVKPLPDSTTAL